MAPGGAPVIDALDLRLEAGSLTALVGPSGAGKTTLLRAIAGLERPSAGAVLLDGRPLGATPTHRRGIAIVFQEPRLFPNLAVWENVAFALTVTGVGRSARRGRALTLLDEVGLPGLADRRTGGLSGGEQQRVALARALCAEPRALLLDEPLAAVDPNRREGLRRLVKLVQAERRLTTLFVTHDRAEAAEMGDTLAVMLDGRIVQHAPPREVFERPVAPAVARFVGSRNLLRGPGGQATIRPEHVELDDGSELRMRVAEATYLGAHVRLLLEGEGLKLEAHVSPAAPPPAGAVVGVRLPPEHLWRFGGPSGVRVG